MTRLSIGGRKVRQKTVAEKEKESIIKELIGLLSIAGTEVRREKLPSGLGYKVASGQCRLREEEMLVLDRNLPLEEQITFLCNYLARGGSERTSAGEALLPESLKHYIEKLRAQGLN
jgi:hypothetical protein